MYRKDFENKALIKGTGSILREAFGLFCRLFHKPRSYHLVKDQVGKIGYEIGDIILVGKKETRGDVVSVHKKIWDKCLKEKKKIVMYLKISGYFYRFDPAEIKESSTNERITDWGETQAMVNFSIREGKNLMKLRAEKVKEDIMAERNSDEFTKELFRLGVFG